MTQKLGGKGGIGVERLDKTLKDVPETVGSKGINRSLTDAGARGAGKATSKSPDLNRRGGGTSAERARKEERDAYDDRVHDMHENIGKSGFLESFLFVCCKRGSFWRKSQGRNKFEMIV